VKAAGQRDVGLRRILAGPDGASLRPADLARRGLALAAYYLVAQRLPERTRPGGELGRRFRAACCRTLFAQSGDCINVEPLVDFGNGRHVRLGEGSSIGRDAHVSGLIAGPSVMIGPELLTIPQDHPLSADGTRWLGDAAGEFRPPEVGEGAWIGARVILLPGVKVGRYCVIGAGAVVTRDIPDYAVAGGVPARIIRFWNAPGAGEATATGADADREPTAG
jgi:maltose O-acetyltransferase